MSTIGPDYDEKPRETSAAGPELSSRRHTEALVGGDSSRELAVVGDEAVRVKLPQASECAKGSGHIRDTFALK